MSDYGRKRQIGSSSIRLVGEKASVGLISNFSKTENRFAEDSSSKKVGKTAPQKSAMRYLMDRLCPKTKTVSR